MQWPFAKQQSCPINPRRDWRFFTHRDRFAKLAQFSKTEGFEIGAFDLPLVEPHEGRCAFGDYRTTEQLQALALKSPGHHVEFVQPVDYDLREGYDQITRQFDWITASHVIEHIPDVIGWIETLDRLLRPGGRVFLVIPDKRYTFDYHRRISTITDLQSAHHRGLVKPSYEQVFDHAFFATDVPDAEFIWRGSAIPPPPRDFAASHSRAEVADREYVDSHCTVFTPESFASIFHQLSEAKAIPLQVGEVWGTQRGQNDFSAVLFKH